MTTTEREHIWPLQWRIVDGEMVIKCACGRPLSGGELEDAKKRLPCLACRAKAQRRFSGLLALSDVVPGPAWVETRARVNS